MLGADHTCVVPLQHEVDRIQAYCRERGVSTERVRFHVEPSELVLPTLPPDPLDFVLIDGSHSFPQVFIDWFYTQRRLEVGGTMMIDDVHVWTGRVLRDFLLAEPEWTLSTTWSARTAVFTKVAPTDDDKVWFEQAYVWRRTRPATLGRARMAAALIRSGEFREFGRRVAQTVRPG